MVSPPPCPPLLYSITSYSISPLLELSANGWLVFTFCHKYSVLFYFCQALDNHWSFSTFHLFTFLYLLTNFLIFFTPSFTSFL